MTVNELAERILGVPDIEGVTYSGGEPFLQAEGLVSLSKILKDQGKTIVCYTGYTYKEIKNGDNPYWHELLNYLDILIDGEFIKEAKAPLLWRGSANQKVHFLSERYKEYSLITDEFYQEFEIHIVDGGVILTGFIEEKVEKKLVEQLEKVGMLTLVENYARI